MGCEQCRSAGKDQKLSFEAVEFRVSIPVAMGGCLDV